MITSLSQICNSDRVVLEVSSVIVYDGQLLVPLKSSDGRNVVHAER